MEPGRIRESFLGEFSSLAELFQTLANCTFDVHDGDRDTLARTLGTVNYSKVAM